MCFCEMYHHLLPIEPITSSKNIWILDPQTLQNQAHPKWLCTQSNPTQINPTQPNPNQPNPTQPNPTQKNQTKTNKAKPNPIQPSSI